MGQCKDESGILLECDDNCPDRDPLACGGYEGLSREIITHPNWAGVQCPPTQEKKKCNQQKCPVDCVPSAWGPFGRCSAPCGSGTRTKVRLVVHEMKHGGQNCGKMLEAEPCNMEDCDQPCVLSEWSEWGACSMGCNIGNQHGYQYRERSVTKEAIGLGKCWDEDGPDRREQKDCNTGSMMRCKGDEKCVAKQD